MNAASSDLGKFGYLLSRIDSSLDPQRALFASLIDHIDWGLSVYVKNDSRSRLTFLICIRLQMTGMNVVCRQNGSVTLFWISTLQPKVWKIWISKSNMVVVGKVENPTRWAIDGQMISSLLEWYLPGLLGGPYAVGTSRVRADGRLWQILKEIGTKPSCATLRLYHQMPWWLPLPFNLPASITYLDPINDGQHRWSTAAWAELMAGLNGCFLSLSRVLISRCISTAQVRWTLWAVVNRLRWDGRHFFHNYKIIKSWTWVQLFINF